LQLLAAANHSPATHYCANVFQHGTAAAVVRPDATRPKKKTKKKKEDKEHTKQNMLGFLSMSRQLTHVSRIPNVVSHGERKGLALPCATFICHCLCLLQQQPTIIRDDSECTASFFFYYFFNKKETGNGKRQSQFFVVVCGSGAMQRIQNKAPAMGATWLRLLWTFVDLLKKAR